jgi:DNA-directed RNA polymerase
MPSRASTDKQFIDRYGDHRIPVSSAKAISTATARRREKEATRQSEIAALTGSASEAAFPSGDSDMTESTESAAVELTPDDVEALAKQNNVDLKEEVIGTHRFVKFRDVLPPCPPRGVFDVKRIKDSTYFFS